MGFMDKAKKMAEQAQTKLDDAQGQFNASQAARRPGATASAPTIEYDQHGRPVRSSAPVGESEPGSPLPPSPPTPPEPVPPASPATPVAPPSDPSPAGPGSPLPPAPPSPPPGDDEDLYAAPRVSSGDPLA